MKHPIHRAVTRNQVRVLSIAVFVSVFVSAMAWSEARTQPLEKSPASSSARDTASSVALVPNSHRALRVETPVSSDRSRSVLVAQGDDEDATAPVKKQAPRTQASNTGPIASRPATTAPMVKQPTDQPDPNDYIIGEQDNLTITVWKEKELSGSVVVRPDGKITVPLVGETKVVGMTPVQVQNLLEEKLKPFIAVPQLTVAVSQINSRRVYLIGQVVKEGSYQINSSTTVLQLIAQAGGLRDFAKRKNIYILRNQGADQNRFSFNYEAVVRGKNQDQNILLQPGDTIVVP